MKPTYLNGVKEAEHMYNIGYTFTELEAFIEKESRIGGYKWSEWCDGFRDSVTHFERLENIAREGL